MQLCGDLAVPEDIESVRVVIYDQNRSPLREGVRELWTCPGPTLHELPQTLEFEPVAGDVFVEVQGLKEGVPVVKSELRTTLSADATEATVSLERSCMGARCAAGETCVDGECELVALAARAVSRCRSSEQPSGQDASQDASMDAGDVAQTTDADSTDAGGSDDAGTPQANRGAYLCPQEDAGSADAGDTSEDAGDTEGDSQ